MRELLPLWLISTRGHSLPCLTLQSLLLAAPIHAVSIPGTLTSFVAENKKDELTLLNKFQKQKTFRVAIYWRRLEWSLWDGPCSLSFSLWEAGEGLLGSFWSSGLWITKTDNWEISTNALEWTLEIREILLSRHCLDDAEEWESRAALWSEVMFSVSETVFWLTVNFGFRLNC